MPYEKPKVLDDIDDVLVVNKIEIHPFVRSTNQSNQAAGCLCSESECNCETKKRYQELLAEERGKLALLTEKAAFKEKEENRSKLVRLRQQALQIEKERALKIASLPPPLPKSIKLLLKQNDESKSSEPDVQMPPELKAVHIEPIDISYKYTENKENIIDPKELEYKQKMREEWDMKAKQRYYEALKKDRQKEEYSKTMKEIQNAELLSRQEMAKNVSAAKKGMPCPLSDKILAAKKQVDMEDATEKIFKKTGAKEHVIEDIEGYQDCYEEKYKKIDSTTEAKMIDCVPSFLKENYDYLLEDDSKFHGGKNFSGFDDSTNDILNQAYIETSPGDDELHERKNIHHEISQLDKLRSSLETEIKQNYIPLLAAAIEIPKKESKDQAVETMPYEVLSEDKAVETDELFKNAVTSPLTTATFDFANAGVMAYKRRPHVFAWNTYKDIPLPEMHQRDVHYVIPLASKSKESTESWSRSTYCSLPPNHGISTSPNLSKSKVFDICNADMKKNQIEDRIQKLIPTPVMSDKENFRNSTASSGKSPFSGLVQQLAQKYLASKSSENSQQGESNIISHSDSVYSNTKTENSAFKKEIVGKPKSGIFNEFCNPKEFNSKITKNTLPEEKNKYQTSFVEEKLNPVTKTETVLKMDESNKEALLNLDIKDNESLKSPYEYSNYVYEAKRIQAIHQVLSRNFPQFELPDNGKSEQENNEKEAKLSSFPSQNEILTKDIYHELSTIQEVDSALTASSLLLSQPKLSDTSESRQEKDVASKETLNDSVQSSEKLRMVSLLDPPDSKVAELAKSIHFIPETGKKINQSLESSVIDMTSSGDKNAPSKESLSTPTLASGSYSTVSIPTPSLPSSDSTQSIPFMASRRNVVSQSVTIPSNLENQSRSHAEMMLLKQTEQTINTIISGCVSETNVLQTSVDNKSNFYKEEKGTHSIMSGYMSDLEVQHTSASDVQHFAQDKIDKIHSVSGYDSDSGNEQMTAQFQRKVSTEHFKPMIPLSNISSPASDIFSFNDKHKQGDGTENFKPMTPLSNISSPASNIFSLNDKHKQGDSTENFKPMTPLSNISSPASEIFSFNDKQGDSTGNFKPMIPHSDVSSPSELATEKFEEDIQNYKKAGNFKYSIPQCDILSSASATSSLNSKQENCNSAEHLKLMIPYSNISSPAELVTHQIEKGIQNSNSVGSFKALTPCSNVSSPTSDVVLSFENVPFSDACSRKLKDKMSPRNTATKPMMLRFNISTDSLTLSTVKNKSSDAKQVVSQLNCNLTLKTVLKPTNYNLTDRLPRTDMISDVINNNIKYGDKSKNNVNKRHKRLHLSKAKQYALTCSSDFFIPSLNEASNFLNDDMNKDLYTVSSTKNCDLNKQESVADLKMTVSDDSKKSEEMLGKISKDNESNSKQRISGKEIFSKDAEGKILVEKSKETYQTQVLLEKLRNQESNLQSLSSASSSSESLSVISRSKVVCQSTPRKNITELIQEPCILEEPNLTLLTTDLSCKIDSTVLQKGPLISVSSQEPSDQEKNHIAESSEKECKTPISPQFLGSPETPSMISFLHHEQSCQQTGNDSVTVQLPVNKNSFPEVAQENTTPVSRDVKRSLFQKDRYKERTKRLWNNLEEVRKRNLAEERKKEIENNRRKAKEFAKKLTPKQRRK